MGERIHFRARRHYRAGLRTLTSRKRQERFLGFLRQSAQERHQPILINLLPSWT